MTRTVLAALSLAYLLSACSPAAESFRLTRAATPIPGPTMSLMAKKGMSAQSAILLRVFKEESELELWKVSGSGTYERLKTYPICRWSGQLGPKLREGDRQAPEGFYDVIPGALNPTSELFLSFNIGYPNAYDRSQQRTGSHIMVHGSCTSSGCFAITDEAMAEVYALAREAFAGGQTSIQLQAFPFRMTPEKMVSHRSSPHFEFWANLQEGYDHFEVTRREPQWSVGKRKYVFAAPDTQVASEMLATRRVQHATRMADLIKRNLPAIERKYDDGGGHKAFSTYYQHGLPTRESGSISRPEALRISKWP